MSAKQANQSRSMHSEQLTLFAMFDAVAAENPLTQALPAGGLGNHRRLPTPPSSGPDTGENPTTTALYGRRPEGGDLRREESPVQVLARRIAELLHAEPASNIDNPRLDTLAHEVFGNVVGHARDSNDAAEGGMNLHIAELGIDVRNGKEAIELAQEITRQMPRQTRHDERQVELQHFSTPPAQACVVVAAAAIRPGMTVLEPSAGTGSLAVLARLAGGTVETNEIDPRRSDLLAMQGFPVTAVDAERLHNLLDPDKSFDAIVMNPPFSATGGRVAGHNTKFGARHVEQALLRLKPGGRLVAVVGQGMALDCVKFRDWWHKIEERYRVRANIGMDGSGYGKFGTSFGNQIIVIDNDGPTVSERDVITGSELLPPMSFIAATATKTSPLALRVRARTMANWAGIDAWRPVKVSETECAEEFPND